MFFFVMENITASIPRTHRNPISIYLNFLFNKKKKLFLPASVKTSRINNEELENSPWYYRVLVVVMYYYIFVSSVESYLLSLETRRFTVGGMAEAARLVSRVRFTTVANWRTLCNALWLLCRDNNARAIKEKRRRINRRRQAVQKRRSFRLQ